MNHQSPRVNILTSRGAGMEAAHEFADEMLQQKHKVIQILIPLPEALLEDREYDLVSELMLDIQEHLIRLLNERRGIS